MKNNADLKSCLDEQYKKINNRDFIESDPVKFPHRYFAGGEYPAGQYSEGEQNRVRDVEISAFLSATIAWGRRDLILRSCERMFGLMERSPASYVLTGNFKNLKDRCVHRTFFEEDLKYFCRGLKFCYEQYGSLESLFASAANIWDGLVLFREFMAKGNKGNFSKHIANALSNSACKRLNLALRWLIRREGPVDLGLWKKLSPASLFIPLDVHVGRIARQLGLLDPHRKANDKKAVIALTEKLRELCPEDPVKYDLALFGMGVTSLD